MVYAPVYHSGEFPNFFLSKSNSVNVLFIVFIFTFFLTKGECKLNLNGIYDNGKSLPEVYRERVLDLHRHGFWKIKISQNMRVSVGYVNKVGQFFEPTGNRRLLRHRNHRFAINLQEMLLNMWIPRNYVNQVYTQVKFNSVCC